MLHHHCFTLNSIAMAQTDDRLLTYVVCAGAVYGAEEGVFHSLFKVAIDALIFFVYVLVKFLCHRY